MPVAGHSSLVVPLPGIASLAPPLGAGPTVPHVPVVDPFTDPDELDEGVLAELRSYFADVVPFGVRLADLSQFPAGPAYLAPEPAAPFRSLAHGVARLFPELPRPRGTVDLVPHVPVALPASGTLEDLRADLAPWLPVTAVATEAALWWREGAEVRVVATFRFGTSAA